MTNTENRIGIVSWAQLASQKADLKTPRTLSAAWASLVRTNARFQYDLNAYNGEQLSDPLGLERKESRPKPEDHQMPFMFEIGATSDIDTRQSNFDPYGFDPQDTFIVIEALASSIKLHRRGSETGVFTPMTVILVGQLMSSLSSE